MAYQQAQIPVTKTEDFEQLKSSLERIFDSAAVEKFYGKLQSQGVFVREFEKIVCLGILESVDSTLAKSGKTAKSSLKRPHLLGIQGDTREEENYRWRSRISPYQYGVLVPKGRFGSGSVLRLPR